MIRLMLVMLMITLSSYGCNPSEKTTVDKPAVPVEDTQEIQQIVKRYTQLLIEGYSTMNMTPMQEVATEGQATKLYHHMAALKEGGNRMLSNLKTIEFQEVSLPSPDKAVVKTKEIWDYTHVDLASGKKFAEEKDFIYEMGYILEKQNERWIITNVNAVTSMSTNTVIPWPDDKPTDFGKKEAGGGGTH